MPISPESDYCIEGAASLCEITTDIAVGAHLAKVDVDAILDGSSGDFQLGERFNGRAFGAVLTDIVEDWWPRASPRNRALMVAMGFASASEPLKELRLEATNRLVTEFLVRRGPNYPEPVNIYGEIIAREPILLPLPSIQALRTPDAIYASINSHPKLRDYIGKLQRQYQRFTEVAPQDFGALGDWLDEHKFIIRRPPIDFGDSEAPSKIRKVTKGDRQVRKAVVRSARLMDAVIQPNAYRAFVSKDGLWIEGVKFNYHASRRRDIAIIDHTADPDRVHIPYNLMLFSKTGRKLGSGCIVFEHIPVLDQVVALTVHVRDRELELDIIRTCNWLLNDDGRADEELKAILPAPPKLTDVDRYRLPPTFYSRTDKYVRRISRLLRDDADRAIAQFSGIPWSLYKFMVHPETLS